MTPFIRSIRSEIIYLYYHLRCQLFSIIILWKALTQGLPFHIPREDNEFHPEDYTISYCYNCGCNHAVYSKGLTRCKSCGTILLPCAACGECDYEFCHQMTVVKHFPKIAAKHLINEDISDFEYERYMAYHRKLEEQRWNSAIAAGEIPF